MSVLVNGFVLGWSVAWPPGPVNAEMIRRGLMPKHRGGGFWSAWPIGLGACTGDFMWALSVSLGAGALLNSPSIGHALAGVSLTLLLVWPQCSRAQPGGFFAAIAAVRRLFHRRSESNADTCSGYFSRLAAHGTSASGLP